MMKRLLHRALSMLVMTLVLAVLVGRTSTALAEPSIKAGETMPDFTVSLSDGTTATLSDLLKENDLVVLNVFATWCGPCEYEFPEMEQVYQTHRDRMTILAVSDDPKDTRDMVAQYKIEHALSFPMGMSEGNIDFLGVIAYPTSFFITSDGRICHVREGAFMTEGSFQEMVDTLLSPDYDGTPIVDETGSDFNAVGMLLLVLLGIAGLLALLCAVGRFLIFRKADVPGWQALVPVLSTYREFDLVWNGWFGVLGLVLKCACVAVLLLGMPTLVGLVALLAFALYLTEGLMLAQAFGKGTVMGVLLTVLPDITRIVLGLSDAQFGANETDEVVEE